MPKTITLDDTQADILQQVLEYQLDYVDEMEAHEKIIVAQILDKFY